jgi:hypothetical protein
MTGVVVVGTRVGWVDVGCDGTCMDMIWDSVMESGVNWVIKGDDACMDYMIGVSMVGTGVGWVAGMISGYSTCMGCMIGVSVVGTGFGSVGTVSVFSGTAKWLVERDIREWSRGCEPRGA